MRELCIFATREDALNAEFTRVGLIHPEIPGSKAWALGDDPDILRGQQYSRVTVSLLAREAAQRAGGRTLVDFNRALDFARAMLRLAPTIWIEI
jgi:hypothetical protein